MLSEAVETTLPAARRAIAVPGSAVAVDPVLAVIEAYRSARARYDDAAAALETLEAQLSADITRCARVVVGKVAEPNGTFKEKSAFSHRQIDQWFDHAGECERRIRGDRFDPEQIARLRAQAHAAFEADAAALAKTQQDSGFTAATERYREADAVETAALEAVCATVPTTLAGAHALLSFLLLADTFEGSDELRELQCEGLRSLQRSLAAQMIR
jgi:multidrug efflux pump subunit AcrA (membrane-fusion protein)